MTTLEELQDLLDDTADDIAQVLPEISEWRGAMVYLLKALEVKAMVKRIDRKMKSDDAFYYAIWGLISLVVIITFTVGMESISGFITGCGVSLTSFSMVQPLFNMSKRKKPWFWWIIGLPVGLALVLIGAEMW